LCQGAAFASADDPTTLMFELQRGDRPILISMPHLGTQIPESLRAGFSDVACAVPDTDWYVDRLWSFAHGVSVIKPHCSRYVIDLNRPSDDQSLYPGQVTTGLCPTETFDGVALYRPGCEPDAAAIQSRVEHYWLPYHQALQAELSRLRERFGAVLLIDAHSIKSQVPRLFAGQLWDINVGTNDSQTLSPTLEQALMDRLALQSNYSYVLNGRFKGGYITRHYGRPDQRQYAVQFELSQRRYMDEASGVYQAGPAAALQSVLSAVFDALQKSLLELV